MSQAAGEGGKGTGLAPNVASLLCYICMPITSIIFMMIEKENKDVQFHAWQGTIVGVAYIVFVIVLNILTMILSAIAGFLAMIFSVLGDGHRPGRLRRLGHFDGEGLSR